MSDTYVIVSFSNCSLYRNLPHHLTRRMERYTLGNTRIPVSIPSIPAAHDRRVRLTSNDERHLNKRSIPGYKIEYLGDIPFFSPDMFHFAIEEDDPVIYLEIKDRRSGDHPRCVRNGRGRCWKRTREHTTITAVDT